MMKSIHQRALPRPAGVEVLETRVLLSADAVLDWNAVAIQAVADDHTPSVVARPEQLGPTRSARALAIVHAAIFDAVNSIDGSFQPYLVSKGGGKHASMKAAVAQAGHDTLAALYPGQRATFDAALRSSLAEVPDGKAQKHGVDLGAHVAKKHLQDRRRDGSDDRTPYSEPVAPGTFQPFPGEPAPLDPNWGKVEPFALRSGRQFRAPPPPALTSTAYAAAYDEVKAFGGDGVTTPTVRTAEQTEIGIYWAYDGTPHMGTPPRLYNQIARVIADQRGNTMVQNARLFALVNIAQADAGIASWETKYAYDFWRPIRGIRQRDVAGVDLDDRNPATAADPNWTPLAAPLTNGPTGSTNFTPPFPSYTSGHATFGAALFKLLANFYGTDRIGFTFVSDEFNGVSRDLDGNVRPLRPRSFTSLSQASEENGQSRIYLGIHWAFDKTAGIAQGNAIADHVFRNVLQPARRGGGHGGGGHGPKMVSFQAFGGGGSTSTGGESLARVFDPLFGPSSADDAAE